MSKGRAATLAAVIAFLVFNANGREIGSYDSQPAKFLAIEIATRGSLSLGRVVGRVPALAERAAFAVDRDGNYRSAYPLPSAIAAGAVAWMLRVTHAVDLRAPMAPALVAKLTASALTALTIALACLAGARRTSVGGAMVIALALAFGTNLWGAVSQTLWQQETALCALMGALLLLADSAEASAGPGAREGSSMRRAIGVGLLLGVAGAARPQLAPTIAVLALSTVVRWRRHAIAALVPLAAIAVAVMAINIDWFGHPLGAVPRLEALHPAHHSVEGSVQWYPWVSAAGLLFSPSRGLLIFSPIVAVAVLGLRRAREEGWRSDLAWCAVAAVTQFSFYSLYAVWWGGHTFGPRYALEVLPPLVPLAAAAWPRLTGSRMLRGAAIAMLCWSVAAAAAGAFVYPAEQWNTDPADIDRSHDRFWDWRDSQLARTVHAPWNARNFTLFSKEAFRRPADSPVP